MALFRKPAPNHRQGITGLTKPAPIAAPVQRAKSVGPSKKLAILVPALAFVAVGSLAFIALQKLSGPQQSVTIYSSAPPSGLASQVMNALRVPHEREKEVARLAILNDEVGPMEIKPLDDVVALTQPDRVFYADTKPEAEPLVVENVEQVVAQSQPAPQAVVIQPTVIANVEEELVKPVQETIAAVDADCFAEVRSLAAKSTIFYKTGSAALDTNALQKLRIFGQTVEKCDEVLVHVTGHSDAVGSEQANMAMSWKRADVAVASLTQLGVDTSQFDPVGFGARSPLSQGDSGDDDLNRRVEFHVLRKHSENP
jgi:outer membrane protein OmpA-like peptidoglycan-associated protein